MTFGDDQPPSLRADPRPATLQRASHFQILILTFVTWDVIKLHISDDGGSRTVEVTAGTTSIDTVFEPVASNRLYTFVARGCAKAIDGSTTYCSPDSAPLRVRSAANSTSLRGFLVASGIDIHIDQHLAPVLAGYGQHGGLRRIMGLT